MPFEIKNIYGLDMGSSGIVDGETPSDATEVGMAEDGEGKECLICLTEPRNTLIMPCGHLCVCVDCGNQI